MDLTAERWLSLPIKERTSYLNKLIAGQTDFDFINLVSAGKLGVYASLGVHFNYAIFGRDSLQVAEDLLETHQDLSKIIIHTLASLQGVRYDEKSEEEPGKIHHEYRPKLFNGQLVPEVSLNILKKLQQLWGDENSDNLRYYGTYDATPLYIRLVGGYVNKYGKEFLNEIYKSQEGEKRIADSIYSATKWLTAKIEASPWLLLEYKRMNKDAGLVNQVWKDSTTSYLHTDGNLANSLDGIASVELQGYAYDALLIASELVAKNDTEKEDWRQLAKQVQDQTIQKLWMPEKGFFAQGLDRSPEGGTRQIQTLTSNPSLLLDSNLLIDLPNNQAEHYVDSVVKVITGEEFITPAGIRSRALAHKQMPGFIDYHGSYTVWPKETYAVARGLKRFGYKQLAGNLESNILHSVMKSGEFYEFFYVNDDNNIWYDKEEAVKYFKSIGLGNDIATPENSQAWTISAIMAIVNDIKNNLDFQ